MTGREDTPQDKRIDNGKKKTTPPDDDVVARSDQPTVGAGEQRSGSSPPRQWREFELVESLGQGASGEVFRAWDRRLQREVALKLIHPEQLYSRKQALREARALARVRHPHVVTVLGIDEKEGLVGLWMEYVKGRTLGDLLARQGVFGAQEASLIMLDCCRAVAAVHKAGLVHGDIKPPNVMREEGGRIVLMDFGLGRPVRSKPGKQAKLAGTPRYMAPELFQGAPLSVRSDMYALGCLFFFLVSGRHPVEGKDLAAIQRAWKEKAINNLRDLRPNLPEALLKVIEKATATQPGHRFASVGELEREITAVQGWKSVSDHRVRQVQTGRRWSYVLMGAAGVLLALLFAFLWGWWPLQVSPPPEIPSLFQRSLITWPSQEIDGRLSSQGDWLSFISSRTAPQALWVAHIDEGDPRQVNLPEGNLIDHLWSPDDQRLACLIRQAEDVRLFLIAPLTAGGLSPTFDIPVHSQGLLLWVDSFIYLRTSEGIGMLDVRDGEFTDRPLNISQEELRGEIQMRGDAERILFSLAGDRSEHIWTAALDGSNGRQLTHGDHSNYEPRWLPRDNAWKIIYTSNKGGQLELWLLDPETGISAQLTSSGIEQLVEDVSMDGSRILYRTLRRGADIFSLDLNSGEERQLTADSLGDFAPTKAAESDEIAFQRMRPYMEGLFRFDTDLYLGTWSGDRVSEARVVGGGLEPRLSANGEWLAYFLVPEEPKAQPELWLTHLGRRTRHQLSDSLALEAFFHFPQEWTPENVIWQSNRLLFVEQVAEERYQLVEYDTIEDLRRVVAEEDAIILEPRPGPPGTVSYLIHEPNGSWKVRIIRHGQKETQDLSDQLSVRQAYSPGWVGNDLVIIVGDGREHSILKLRPGGTSPTLVVQTRGNSLSYSARLIPKGRLLLTVDEGNIHNIGQIALRDGSQTKLTANELPGISFGGFEPVNDNLVLFCKQLRNDDLWLMDLSWE